MRRAFPLMVLAFIFGFSGVFGTSAQESPATPSPVTEGSLLAALAYPEIQVTSDGVTHDFPTELEAGRYHIVLDNQSEAEVSLEFWQLPTGVTLDDLNAFLEEANQGEESAFPDFFYDMVFNGGPVSLPGQTNGAVLDLAPGEWIVNHFVINEATGEESDAPSPIVVTGEMPALDDPVADAEIALIDMDFVVPDTFASGPQIWKVVNKGLQIHHLIMMGVPEGTTEDDLLALVASFEGPPASPEAGDLATPALTFDVVTFELSTTLYSRNQFNLIEVDLQPGTYAMICFMPDPSGTPHIMLGMVEIITVE